VRFAIAYCQDHRLFVPCGALPDTEGHMQHYRVSARASAAGARAGFSDIKQKYYMKKR